MTINKHPAISMIVARSRNHVIGKDNQMPWKISVDLQLSRDFLPLPKLNILRKPDSIFNYEFEDFEIAGYESHPAIKAPVAI